MNAIQRKRFRELRQRQLSHTLTPSDRDELAALIQSVERAEVAQLAPASARLRREIEQVETQNRDLETLLQRKEALLQRLRSLLAEMEAERRGIREEQARILAVTAGQESGTAG